MDLVPTAVAARSCRISLERRRVVPGRPRGLLGHLLEPDDLVRAVAGQFGQMPTRP